MLLRPLAAWVPLQDTMVFRWDSTWRLLGTSRPQNPRPINNPIFGHHRDEGGAQDNQFSNVKRFLREAQACRDPNTLFLAICDGSYYQRPHDGRPSRLQALAEDFPGQRNAVCSLADLPNIWVAAVKVWQGQLA